MVCVLAATIGGASGHPGVNLLSGHAAPHRPDLRPLGRTGAQHTADPPFSSPGGTPQGHGHLLKNVERMSGLQPFRIEVTAEREDRAGSMV
jgi:hypothetical protein